MWSRVSKGKADPSLLVLQLEYPPERLRLMLKNVDWREAQARDSDWERIERGLLTDSDPDINEDEKEPSEEQKSLHKERAAAEARYAKIIAKNQSDQDLQDWLLKVRCTLPLILEGIPRRL